MYVPSPFREDQKHVLHDFVRGHPFATLVSTDEDALPFATALPLLLDADRGPNGTLLGHLARPNPQAGHLAAGREVLAIFHGPHAYVSPTWYQTAPAVPTWNYVTVHARGAPRVINDAARVRELLETTVRAFEPPGSAWSSTDLPERYLHSMAGGVVAFELPISRLDGKFKLSQNRSIADRSGVAAALRSGGADEKAVAAMMSES